MGAAVETKDGTVFIGANMENASYGVTVCAEVGALQSASTAGKLSQITCVAVVGGCADPTGNEPRSLPCGRCRQLIFETSRLGNRDLDVWCADETLTSVKKFKISELLVHGFYPEKLGGRDLESRQVEG